MGPDGLARLPQKKGTPVRSLGVKNTLERGAAEANEILDTFKQLGVPLAFKPVAELDSPLMKSSPSLRIALTVQSSKHEYARFDQELVEVYAIHGSDGKVARQVVRDHRLSILTFEFQTAAKVQEPPRWMQPAASDHWLPGGPVRAPR